MQEVSLDTYLIPGQNMPVLKEKITKLNKRARKLNCPEIKLEEKFSHIKRAFCPNGVYDPNNVRWIRSLEKQPVPSHYKDTGVARDYFFVTVTGSSPCYNGWKLMGVLSPITLDDGSQENIIRAVPGFEIPSEYRVRVGQCDHCKITRYRKETYVVVNEDEEETRMVGSSCLKDFLGHQDPHAIASMAEILFSLEDFCRGAEDEGWLDLYGGSLKTWSLDKFLEVTGAIIHKEGWVSGSKARDSYNLLSTKERVLMYLNPPAMSFRTEDCKKWMQEIQGLMEQKDFRTQAQEAIDWLLDMEVPEDNGYLYNLNLLARAGYVQPKTAGFAASIISFFKRSKDEVTLQQTLQESEYVGELKKRMELVVSVYKVFATTSEGSVWRNGVVGVHSMKDESGNELVWFASQEGNWLEEGKKYKVKATPVKYGTFKGRKQTTINRVVVLKEIE